jgi:alkylmercury lyase-like protein
MARSWRLRPSEKSSGDSDLDVAAAGQPDEAWIRPALAEAPAGASAALATAEIPASKLGPARHRRLADSERALYFWILHRFAASGRPSSAEARKAAVGLGLDAERAFQTFAREDLVHLDREGEIAVAYPFSGRPTAHVVRFGTRHEAHAMCAIDALGIAPMFDEPIQIASRDPLTEEEIAVELQADGTGTWRPYGTVVVSGASGSGESCDSCCPVLNFFASRANGERWLEARPEVRGQLISMPEAIAAGRAVFGDVLEPG